MSSRAPVDAAAPDYERFYALVPDLMAVVGFDGLMTSVNPAWTNTLGWSHQELTATPYTEFIVEDDVERTLAEITRLASEPDSVTVDFTIRLKTSDGGTRNISFSAQANDERDALYVVGKDVTQRIAESEALRNLAASVSDAVISADVNGTITHWNVAAEAMLGYSAQEMIGQPLELIMPERYRNAHAAGITRLREGAEPKLIGGTVDIEALRADGTELPVELSLGSYSAMGDTVYTGVIRDASERRRVERAQAAQLAASAAFDAGGTEEEMLAAVLAGLGMSMGWTFGGLWIEDPDDGKLHCSATWHADDIDTPWFEQMSRDATFAPGEGLPGRAWQRRRGVRIADLALDDNFPRLQAAVAEGYHGGVAVPVMDGEHVFAVLDFFHPASDRMDEESVEAMYALGIQAGHYLARRRAGDALASANASLSERAAELERSNADLEQFAYVASHDLAEPLRSIAGFTQLLEHRYKDKLDDDATEFIGFIVDGVARMQALIDDLLLFSRVGRSDQLPEAVDMNVVAEQAVRSLGAVIEEAGATVNVGDLPQVHGRTRELGQLVGNLISNAVKFRGERPPVIDISVEPQDGMWAFTISDNGIGIEERHAERIFKMFQRLHARDEYPGTGIGLALCRKVVESHGGTISVESVPGEGSAFHFTIPKEAPSE